MDRKKTILIAVLINAGLLVLLFVVALHHEEPKSVEVAQSVESKPLFNDGGLLAEAPLAAPLPDGQLAGQPSVAAPLAAPMAPAAPSGPGEIVHQLPPVAPQQEPVQQLAAVPALPPAAPIAAQPMEIKVKKGDSLERIAKAHKTTVDELIRLNQLPSSFLRVGQKLKLPASPGHFVQKKLSAAADRPAVSGQTEYYTVKVGDNPWTIASKHHMKVDELLKVNNLSEEKARRLKPGDRLRVR